jgi:nitroreductase
MRRVRPSRPDTFPGEQQQLQRDAAKTPIPRKETNRVNTLDAIHSRRSIRKYLDKPVPPDVFQQVLSAAMYAPSACNQQPWQFVVLDDRKLLREVPKINSYAAMAAEAPVAILVCGDSSLETVPGYWVIDCSAAVQNLLLAAHALGLGAVWTGVYPQQERVEGFRRLLGLPKHVTPHSLVPLGYPAEQPPQEERCRADRVHRNGW